ncbi:MAG: tyrosine/phenylalanine carboxypeptidase domain-containing protein [Elusimicrobiota bacterium]
MKNIDNKLLKIINKFPFYVWLTPVNKAIEREKFFSNNDYNPVFKYEINKSLLQKIKTGLDNVIVPESSCFGEIYNKLIQEYLLKIRMIENLNKPEEFTRISKLLYGIYSRKDSEEADDILEKNYEQVNKGEIRPGEIKKTLLEKIRQQGINNWDVELSNNIMSKVTVKPKLNKILVHGKYKYLPGEDRRLAVHEIEVHLFRALNGDLQKYSIFKTGLAGYLETEEGLAVYYERRKKVCSARQMKIYAGRLKAVQKSLSSSFAETYRFLRRWFDRDTAYILTQRAKRGLTDTSKPGALTKDAHYISGHRKAGEYIQNNGDLKYLFVGKVGINDVDLIKKLIDSGRIKEPLYMPLI